MVGFKRFSKASKTKLPKDKKLPKLTVFFFDRPKLAALLWVALIIFGGLSYTTLLRREGFPSVNIPFSFVGGAYFGNDSSAVDANVAKPISDLALKQPEVESVQTSSAQNFFQIQIQYKEGTDAKASIKSLEKSVAQSGNLPKDARVQYNVPYFGATGGDTDQIDVAVSFFADNADTPLSELTAKANVAAKYLNDQHLSLVKSVSVKAPYETVANPMGGSMQVQKSFDRFGHKDGSDVEYHQSVLIGIAKTGSADVIKLDAQVRDALKTMSQQAEFKGYSSEVSASFAPQIKDNLSELQRVLLEGLIAVLVVGSIVIAMRASAITVLSMITVLLFTLGFLYVIGYTLNVITLFALILGLALIVDDTIIMVEAIDSARHNDSDPRVAIKDATTKISRAMVAATLTASLSFAPLLFVGGILGEFIRAIPVTIISALIISLFVALIFIPFMARFLLLGKKQMGASGVKEIAAGFENRLAAFIAGPMIWARNSKKRLFSVGITAMIIGFGFLFAGLSIGKNVIFNIFPPTKDSNGLILNINFPPSTTISQAEKITSDADKIAVEVIGGEFIQSSNYASGSAQTTTEQIELTSYSKRKITSVEIAKKLQDRYDKEFTEARVVVGQADVGPPSAAFVIQIDATKREAAQAAASNIAAFLKKTELKRPSGKVAKFINTSTSSPDTVLRSKGNAIVTVSAGFDGNDTTTLVTLAQDAVKKEYTPERLKDLGLDRDAIKFDLGQESENQDSFKTLALAFPILLAVMFVLLAFQFRSLVQPLLIFMAIPFSIFGVMLGLYLTDNAISFFTMLGFFALIGLSIKNTILLTDYANQARRSGLSAIDAAVAALEERFRPLFATSMTAVVSLIPLALSSPFWQGLAVVLIFGLLSSTTLVVTVFPYYYLGAEYARSRVTTKQFFSWLVPTLIVAILVSKLLGGAWFGLTFLLSLVYLVIDYKIVRRRLA